MTKTDSCINYTGHLQNSEEKCEIWKKCC